MVKSTRPQYRRRLIAGATYQDNVPKPKRGRPSKNVASLDLGNITLQDINTQARKALRPRTWKKYDSHLNSFRNFCRELLSNPTFEIADEGHNIGLYLAKYLVYLSQNNYASSSFSGTRAAVNKLFRNQHNREGRWEFDEETRTSKGNPADCVNVVDIVNAAEKESSGPTQSRAITKDEVVLFIQWLEGNPEVASEVAKMYSAMAVLCFYCWFRFDEVVSLQIQDFRWDHPGVVSGETFILLDLADRKTNARGLTSHKYEIHPSVEDSGRLAGLFEGLNVYERLILWLETYRCLRKTPEKGSDFLFPALNRGEVFPDQEFNPSSNFNDLLQQFAQESNIFPPNAVNPHFSFHCFRRGGAQNVFFKSKRQPNLNSMLTWGGWSTKEGLKTMMNYLINEYHENEHYEGDLFSKHRRDHNFSVNPLDLAQPLDSQTCSCSCATHAHRNLELKLEAMMASFKREMKELYLSSFETRPNLPSASSTTPIYQILGEGFKRAERYEDLIMQWTNGDERTDGLPYKDLNGKLMKQFKISKSYLKQRRDIYKAFEDCGCDHGRFAQKYPLLQTKYSISSLLREIASSN